MNLTKKIFLIGGLLFSMNTFAAQTWVLIGDSIMSLVSPSKVNGPEGHANQQAAFLIQKERNVNLRNVSSPGNSLGNKDFSGFAGGSNAKAILETIGGVFNYYNGVIVQVGTNDFSRSVPWADTVTGLRHILNQARAMNKKVLVMEPIWRRDQNVKNAAGNTLDTYRFFIYIVCTNEYPDICRYASRSSSALADERAAKFYDANEVAKKKELHLNAAGQRAYANWVKLEAAKNGFF